MSLCCRALGVGRPGYYRWQKHKDRKRKRDAVLSELREIRQTHKRIGVRQLQKRLKRTKASYGTVYKLCKENGLMSGRRARGITRRDLRAEAAEDLVRREFYAEHPMKKLLNDMTEMNCKDGKLYLAATLDCFDGAVVGFSMAGNKRAELCRQSCLSAFDRYGRTPGMILHSDHGSQYTSRLFRDFLKAHNARQSMGRTGSCFDNARMESFFATLKKELIYGLTLSQLSRQEVMKLIFRWIECDYNTVRPHSGNEGDLPPLEKRRAYNARKAAA